MACCQHHKLLPPAVEEWRGADQERPDPLLDESRERCVEFAFSVGANDQKLYPQAGRLLHVTSFKPSRNAVTCWRSDPSDDATMNPIPGIAGCCARAASGHAAAAPPR